MSSAGAAPRAAGPAPGAPARAATPVSNARAAASRKNGAKSRGPRSAQGKARSAQNALKHGMRALTYVVLPDESAAEFAALEAALVRSSRRSGRCSSCSPAASRSPPGAWSAPIGWPQETELFAERRWDGADLGVALIRDGNGTRSFETLMRYRNAAMAELMRALRTLKALQAEQADLHEQTAGADLVREIPVTQLAAPAPGRAQPSRRAARLAHADLSGPNKPERLMAYVLPEPPMAGPPASGVLHENAATWLPNEPEPAPRGTGAR